MILSEYMKKGAGKRKGSSFEREFCKELSLWWTDGKDKDVFWRTHSSGARHGISEECGDVMAVKECGHPLMDKVMFELKHWNRNDLLLDLIRSDKKSELKEAWEKCQQESCHYKRVPILVLKITNKATICLVRKYDYLVYGTDPVISKGPYFLWDYSSTYIMEWDLFRDVSRLSEWKNAKKE
jgi:hypothetical protein